MADGQVYALDQGGNKIVTLSAAQILAAIQSAISTGKIPAELETLVDSIREQNDGKSTKIWVGTQAEFEAIEATEEGMLYFITDQTTVDDLSKAISDLEAGLANGTTKPADSKNVTDKIAGKNITDIFESNGTTAKKATEVTGKINGKNISDIFESDGTTAKKATEVTGKINGQNIANIFESNGTTVKYATNATTLRKYQHNVHITCDHNAGGGSSVVLGLGADIFLSFIDSTAAIGGSLFSQSMVNKTFPASGVFWTYTDEANPAMLYNIIAVTIVLDNSIPTIRVTVDRTGGLVLNKEQKLPPEACNIQSDTIINL